MTRFEAGLLDEIRANHGEILADIRTSQALSDETQGKLKSALESYAKTFVAS